MTSPGRAGRTSRGVTMMARSVSFFWYEALRNSAPSTGTSPSQGNCEIAFCADALQQAADHEALAVAQLDRGRGAAHDQRRHRDALRPAPDG